MHAVVQLPRLCLVSLLLSVSIADGASGLSIAVSAAESAPASIVDLHCHTAGIGAGGSGCFVSEQMRRSFKTNAYLHSFGVTEAELNRCGDGLVIERIAQALAGSRYVTQAVVLAMDGVVDDAGNLDRARTEIYVPNEFVAAEVRKHPNLLFGASVNPYRTDALERLNWAKAHGAVLVKWLPSVQQIDPADPRLVAFYDRLVALNLPLLTHTGTEHAFTHAEDRWSDPERLRLPLSRGVTVIAAHAATTGRSGGERSMERLARLMREYPNLYAEVSSLTQLNKRGHLREVLRRAEFSGRLVYGTDFPLISMKMMVSPWYHFLQLSWRQCLKINRIENPWDRDVALKQALGMADFSIARKLVGSLSQSTNPAVSAGGYTQNHRVHDLVPCCSRPR